MRRSHGGGGGRRRAGAQTGAGEGEIEEGGIGPDGLMVVVMVMMGGRKSPGTGRGGERSRISSTRGGVIVGSIIISSSSSSSSSSMGMVGSRRNRRSRRWCCGGGREKNGVEIISKEGYWVKAKLIQENEYIIAHQNHIARLWSMDFNNQDFIIDKVEINDRLCIATKLSKRQALLKIGAAYKTAEVRAGVVVYGPKIGVDMNPSVRGFLATIPLFAQAKGHVLLSLWISIALLLLDILRSPLYTIYDSIFNQISTLIMLHCFKHRVWLYRVFSILSPRWSYGDMLKKCVYNGKECGFLVHTLAVFKERDDYELTFGYGDYESSYPTLEDQHFMINYNRIYALPILPKMGSYCKVICKIDSIVVGKASYSDIYPPL